MAITRFKDLDLTRQYTYAEYLTWRFSERVELLRGWVAKMSPAPSRYHQEVAGALHGTLFQYFIDKPCRLYLAPFDVRLPRTAGGETVVQPDLCVVCDEAKLTDQGCSGAPDLVIEILSPGNSTREMREKYALYEEAGVREYWVIEPSNHLVLRYELRNGTYIGLAPKTAEDDDIRPVIFPDLSVTGKRIFGL
ncbi:MAG: Uma2 family endonuclease [Saprospiraceae bacterium]